MVELSVGYAAGLVALGMFIAQVFCPTLITFILAGIVRDEETAATLSVVGRSLQSSYWPEILRSDSARPHGVRKTLFWATEAIPFVAILVAVAGVVTPLGLYDTLEPSGSATPIFRYIKDPSPFGLATQPRTNNFTRLCSSGHGIIAQGPAPCPYTNNTVIFSTNSTSLSWELPNGYNMSVPSIVQEIYSSGTHGKLTTISNYFDIHWRQYTTVVSPKVNDEQPYYVGNYRMVRSMVMDDTILPIEGLVVDAKFGGLGFRNHTIPIGMTHGSTWEEDLLFIQPETSCVDTNLTLDFTMSSGSGSLFNESSISELWLTDHGGFVDLNQTYPIYDHPDAQMNADLEARAYKAAWLNNVMTMAYMSVTNPNNGSEEAFSYMNSAQGKRFQMTPSSYSYNSLQISSTFGYYLFDAISGQELYPNPFRVSSVNFSTINVVCSGATAIDIANISNIFVMCGLMRGIPQRIDGGYPVSFEGGSKWSAPMYSCASAVKANVKTVHFLFNGTTSRLGDLSITKIVDKEYSDDSSMPLWGVEDSGLALDGISPVWGLIAPEYAEFPNISVVRKPSLYLVADSDLGVPLEDVTQSGINMMENLPGSDFAPASMFAVYKNPSQISLPDYTGVTSLGMYVRWANLSNNAMNASSIINLIWTDIAAQGAVGTKGILGPLDAGVSTETIPIVVSPIVRKLKYHYAFGVPAFILAAVFVFIGLVAAIASVTKTSSFAILHARLRQSSTGRIFTTFQYPLVSNLEMSSKEWSEALGAMQIDLRTKERAWVVQTVASNEKRFAPAESDHETFAES